MVSTMSLGEYDRELGGVANTPMLNVVKPEPPEFVAVTV